VKINTKIILAVIILGTTLTGYFISSKKANISAQEINKELINAVQNNNIYLVEKFLKEGADICIIDHISKTALIYATEGGHIEIAKLLIENGAHTCAIRRIKGITINSGKH
jgi:ankyrin repeat protein